MAENERFAPAGIATAVGLGSLLFSGALSGLPDPRVAVARVLAAVVVYFWAEDIYGRASALGATLLFSFHPLVAAAAPGDGGAVPALLLAAAAYRAQRCLLDPSVQDAAAIGLVGGVALWITPAALGLAPLLVAQAVARLATRHPHEAFARTLRGCASALLVTAVVMAASARLLGAVAVPRSGLSLGAPAALGAGYWIAPLILIGLRPWRPRRRYSDAGVIAAAVFPAVAAWWCEATPLAAARAALPAATVLAAAVWDGGSAGARRAAAWGLVVAQIAALAYRAVAA